MAEPLKLSHTNLLAVAHDLVAKTGLLRKIFIHTCEHRLDDKCQIPRLTFNEGPAPDSA
jgi:hypothetical protein